eukprot:6198944-Pleurochrysis_carterae.AAC.2
MHVPAQSRNELPFLLLPFSRANHPRSLLFCSRTISQEEIDEFLSFAVDPETGTVNYEDYVSQVCPA